MAQFFEVEIRGTDTHRFIVKAENTGAAIEACTDYLNHDGVRGNFSASLTAALRPPGEATLGPPDFSGRSAKVWRVRRNE